MTHRPETLEQALEDRDITLALTPGQLVALVVAVFLLVRILKRLRG